MRKEITDEQLDQMMQKLVSDASANSEEMSDIAASPTVWWAIQREINAQKERSRSPWPPANVIRRWLLIALPAAAAVGLVLSFLYFRTTPAVEQARQPLASTPIVTAPPAKDEAPTALTSRGTDDNAVKVATPQKARLDRSPSNALVRDRRHTASTLMASTEKKGEIKTDFIALTYARNPDSGQVVRVKVPSSMMVSLGVVSSVNKPSDLVDAEVVVGDDGLTRAIRFIR